MAGKLMAGIMLALTGIGGIPVADATSGFARQTQAACKLCHAERYTLNAYGRKFRMHGFRETAKMLEFRSSLEKKSKMQDATGSETDSPQPAFGISGRVPSADGKQTRQTSTGE